MTRQSVDPSDRKLTWASAARRTATISAAFCLIVGCVLAVSHVRAKADPLNSPKLQALRQKLLADPTNESIRGQMLAMDQSLREEYFSRQRFMRTGAVLLVGGAAALLLSAGAAAALRWRPPMPPRAEQRHDDSSRQARLSRLSLAGMGVAVALAMVAAGVAIRMPALTVEGSAAAGHGVQTQDLGAAVAGASASAPASEPATQWALPSAEEVGRNWPQFRGPGGAASWPGEVPTNWNGKTGQNILWKAAVPLPGKSSPVVWKDRVFVTGATDQERAVFCFDAKTGKLLWTGKVKSPPAPGEHEEAEPHEDTGYAAPTGATDGQRFFAIFTNGEAACFDYHGRQLWARNLGPVENAYGHAASLVMHEDKLLVQLDQGHGEDGPSALLALDAATGALVWKVKRPVSASWTSPIVIEGPAGPQVVTVADPFVIAYDPVGGKELWRVEGMRGEVAPSPIYAGGLVIAAHSEASAFAIRPNGSGNVTKSHVAWSADEGLPELASPASDGELLYLIAPDGTLTCYQVADGTKVYEENLKATIWSSPAIAGKRLYVIDEKGVTHVIQAGSKFGKLAANPLGETCHASPAFADGTIFIRGEKHLFCVAAKSN